MMRLLIYFVGGAGLVCGLWLAFKSFHRALRAPRLDLPGEEAAPGATPGPQQDIKTPDERLAHLLKKTDK